MLLQTGHTTGPRHYRVRSVRNCSTHHCSLRPRPHINKYWQAAACPRAAQQKRRRTEVSVPHSGSPGTVGRHNNTPNRVASDACAIGTRPLRRPRAACGARPLIERRKPLKFLQGHSIRPPDRKGPEISGPTTSSFRNNDLLSKSARLFDKTVGGHR